MTDDPTDPAAALLDERPAAAGPADGGDGVAIDPVALADEAPPVPPGDTALLVDDWCRRKADETLWQTSSKRDATPQERAAAADLFAVAFEPDPTLRPEGCVDPRQQAFVAELLQLPDTAALRADTVLSADAAEIATLALFEQYQAYLAACDKAAPPPPPPKGEKADDGKPPAAAPPPALVRAAARKAAKAAEGEVESAEAASDLLGGKEPGESTPGTSCGRGDPGGDKLAADKLAGLHRRIRQSPALRRICELAGRFRRMAAGVQREKVSHGCDDVLGVEPTGDPARLLPAELARLADAGCPQAELDQLRRIAERACMGRELRAAETVGKGPIVVTIDESGSMHGEKVYAAKALALAMAWVARRQRRWCVLVAYSGEDTPRVLDLRPGRKPTQAQMTDWLERFLSGGSNIDIPVRELPGLWRELSPPPGKTDVLMVTDAECNLPPEVTKAFNAWRKEQNAKVTALVVGGASGSTLAAVADKVLSVGLLTADSEAAAEAVAV